MKNSPSLTMQKIAEEKFEPIYLFIYYYRHFITIEFADKTQ